MIACSPDNRRVLVEAMGWHNTGRLRYYCVSTDNGSVIKSFREAKDLPYMWWQ